MAVRGPDKNRGDRRAGESGQSVLEFIFMLPVMLGMMMLMLHVNAAIQMSIVDQQYARAQALWLTFNSAYYPQIGSRIVNMQEKKFNQMVIGISENSAPETGSFDPESSTQLVARSKKKAGRLGAPGEETARAGVVRIRDTVTLCTQSNIMQAGGSGNTVAVSSENWHLLSDTFDPKAFMYCRSPFDEQ